MAEAVCLRCGDKKPAPWRKCKRCRYDPRGDEDALVKSVYLSVGRFTDPTEQGGYRVELDRLATGIERGEPPTFPKSELDRLRAQKELFDRVGLLPVWGAVFRLFLPAIGLLILLFGIAYVLRVLL